MAFPQGYEPLLPVQYSCNGPGFVVVPGNAGSGLVHARRRGGDYKHRVHRYPPGSYAGAVPVNIETAYPGYCPGSYTPYPQGIVTNPVITQAVQTVVLPTARQQAVQTVPVSQPARSFQLLFPGVG